MRNWLWSWLTPSERRQPAVRKGDFERRERDLRERLSRLEAEADVVTRSDSPEHQSWAER